MFSELLKMAPTFYSSCSNYSTHTPTGPLVMLSKGKTLKFIYELPVFKSMLKILSLATENAPYSHQKAQISQLIRGRHFKKINIHVRPTLLTVSSLDLCAYKYLSEHCHFHAKCIGFMTQLKDEQKSNLTPTSRHIF